MNSKNLILFPVIAIFALSACKKNNTSKPSNVDVYLAGVSTSANYHFVATYWKNGVPAKLADSSVYSMANSIAVSGDDVYIAGEVAGAAVLWKNGVAMTLSSTGAANTVVAFGSDVYVGGNIAINGKDVAVYWKNGNMVTLPDSVSGTVTAIAINGNDVYLAGYIDPSYGNYTAMTWKNGVSTKLSDGTHWAQAFGIAVSGNDIYVSGFFYNNYNTQIAAYWKNGTIHDLTDSTSYAFANAAMSNNNNIYITGSTRLNLGHSVAVYWKNGSITALTTVPSDFVATAIAAYGSDIYTAGYSYTSGGSPVLTGAMAYYWKNGVAVKVSKGSASSAEALGIAIVQR